MLKMGIPSRKELLTRMSSQDITLLWALFEVKAEEDKTAREKWEEDYKTAVAKNRPGSN